MRHLNHLLHLGYRCFFSLHWHRHCITTTTTTNQRSKNAPSYAERTFCSWKSVFCGKTATIATPRTYLRKAIPAGETFHSLFQTVTRLPSFIARRGQAKRLKGRQTATHRAPCRRAYRRRRRCGLSSHSHIRPSSPGGAKEGGWRRGGKKITTDQPEKRHIFIVGVAHQRTTNNHRAATIPEDVHLGCGVWKVWEKALCYMEIPWKWFPTAESWKLARAKKKKEEKLW